MYIFSDYNNDFGWRYEDAKNNFPKQHGHSQHVNGKSKKAKLQEKKSRRINRGKKFNHN